MERSAFITGSTGVVGFALARRLLSRGLPVIAPVRSYENPTGLMLKRSDALALLKQEGGDNFHSVLQPQPLEAGALNKQGKLFKKCDVIYHLGGWSGHKISAEELPQAFATNVLWTGALVKMAAEKKVSRFVFASTRAVYDFVPRQPGVPMIVNEGTKIELPADLANWKGRALLAFDDYLGGFLTGRQKEAPEEFAKKYLSEYPLPDLPKNLWYPLTKLMGEGFVASLSTKGIEGISLRFKPVFGPSPVEQESRTIPRTVNKLLKERTETAWPESCGYLYLEDLVYALEAIKEWDKPFNTNVFLLGQKGQSISQYELFKKISGILGKGFVVDENTKAQAREDEIYDTSFAMEEPLRYRNTPFFFALGRTVQYFADYHFLNKAIELAASAGPQDICKVGAIVVKDGEILGSSFKDSRKRVHSDVLAIAEAIKTLGQRNKNIADTAGPAIKLLEDSILKGSEEGKPEAVTIRRLIWEITERLREELSIDIFKGATIYINIDPCNTERNLMGCAEIIAKSGIKRVVFAARDPGLNKGPGPSTYLREQGVEVVEMKELADKARSIDPEWFMGRKISRHRELLKAGK